MVTRPKEGPWAGRGRAQMVRKGKNYKVIAYVMKRKEGTKTTANGRAKCSSGNQNGDVSRPECPCIDIRAGKAMCICRGRRECRQGPRWCIRAVFDSARCSSEAGCPMRLKRDCIRRLSTEAAKHQIRVSGSLSRGLCGDGLTCSRPGRGA